jgi:hypothetical protein
VIGILTTGRSHPDATIGDKKVSGALEKFQNETIFFVMSVCPSALKNSAPTGRSFMKFYISVFF